MGRLQVQYRSEVQKLVLSGELVSSPSDSVISDVFAKGKLTVTQLVNKFLALEVRHP
jgi:hypothetical protein